MKEKKGSPLFSKLFLVLSIILCVSFLSVAYALVADNIFNKHQSGDPYQFSYDYELKGASVFTEVTASDCIYFNSKKYALNQVEAAYLDRLAEKGIDINHINVKSGCDYDNLPILKFNGRFNKS